MFAAEANAPRSERSAPGVGNGRIRLSDAVASSAARTRSASPRQGSGDRGAGSGERDARPRPRPANPVLAGSTTPVAARVSRNGQKKDTSVVRKHSTRC